MFPNCWHNHLKIKQLNQQFSEEGAGLKTWTGTSLRECWSCPGFALWVLVGCLFKFKNIWQLCFQTKYFLLQCFRKYSVIKSKIWTLLSHDTKKSSSNTLHYTNTTLNPDCLVWISRFVDLISLLALSPSVFILLSSCPQSLASVFIIKIRCSWRQSALPVTCPCVRSLLPLRDEGFHNFLI